MGFYIKENHLNEIILKNVIFRGWILEIDYGQTKEIYDKIVYYCILTKKKKLNETYPFNLTVLMDAFKVL